MLPSNGSTGVTFASSAISGTFQVSSWRNNSFGISLTGISVDLVLNNIVLFTTRLQIYRQRDQTYG